MSAAPPPVSADASEESGGVPWHLLVHAVQDYAIFMLDPTGHIRSWNVGAQRIKGWRAEEIIGRHFSTFYPPEDVAAGKPDWELRVAVAEGRCEDEGWRVRADGTRFWANVVITALRDDTGALRGFGKVTRDLTERRRAEQDLRESEERFRLLVQGVVDYAIFMLDPSGRVVSWNAGAERIKGYRADEILGRHFSVFFPSEDVAAGKPEAELRLAAAEGRCEDEGWRVRADGTRFWANVVITALHDETGALRGYGKVTRDLTERRAAEQTLSERRRLVTHLVEAQETERRRIAWDVHDDSIQSMVAVGMRLQLLARHLPPEYQPALSRLDDTVRDTISRLRNLVFRLRPPAIDQDGLASALRSFLVDLEAETGIAHRFRYEVAAEPSQETSITIFRICQEALTNVHKHAQASAVRVSLVDQGGGVLVRVTDNGVGAATPAASAGHYGLIEMRERAEIAGGWWTLRGEPDGGTTVEFWVPDLGRGAR